MARRYGGGDYRPPPPPWRFPPVPASFPYQPPSCPFDPPPDFPPPFFPVRAPFSPSAASHNLIFLANQALLAQMFVPILPRDLILERERERIRDEIIREEVRRKIIEEEVRKEIQMERKSRVRNGFRNPNRNHAIAPCSCNCSVPPVIINLEESDEETLPNNTTENHSDGYKDKAVSEPQLVEIQKDQFEKEAKNWVVKRNKDEAVNLAQLEENKGQCFKEAESSGPKRNVEHLSPNTEEAMEKSKKRKKQKGPRKEFNCVICQLTLYTDVSWMIHLNGKKHRRKAQACVDKPPLFEETQLEKNKDQCEKEAASSSSKRKLVNLSTDTEGVEKSKKQKGPSKEFNCVICQLTERTTELCWSSHLNGKKHKRKAEKYYADNPNLKEKNSEEKNTEEKPDELNLKEKERASNLDIQPAKKKILVKGEEIVVKNNRLFCEKCGFNCSTTLMMEIHLGSEKHKANSEQQIN